jgi:simple sugar transport system ATP-binding protein
MTMASDAPLVEVRGIVKHFGSVIALSGVSMTVARGEVLCLLGDNGAGKSTLIKILSGVYWPTRGDLLVEGAPVAFASPRDALDAGIATVYQDLAMIPLMAIWRNFSSARSPPAAGDRSGGSTRRRPGRRPGGAGRDGHRHPRPRPARRHPVRG